MSTTTIKSDPTVRNQCLYMSMELGEGTWKLGFTTGFGEKLSRRRVASRDAKAILAAIDFVKRAWTLRTEWKCEVVMKRVETDSGYTVSSSRTE